MGDPAIQGCFVGRIAHPMGGLTLKGPLEIVGGQFYAPFFDYAP